jgi:hypothetical protein
LEPQRTNLVTQSNKFDTTWISVNVTSSSNQIGVGGSVDAWKITSTSASGYLRYNSGDWSGERTFSVYAKAGSLNSIQMTGFGNTFFNLETGVIGTSAADSAEMQDMGNGWYRCSVTGNTTPSQVRLYPSNNEDTSSTGNVFIQYAQVEQGYPTSYIPTQGSAVTRVEDVCNNGGNDQVINSTEGVLYAEIAALANDGTTRRISLKGSNPGDRLNISFIPTTNRLQCFGFVGNVLQFNFTPTLTDTTQFNKIALKYKENDFALWVNGVEVLTDTSGITWSANTLNELLFGNSSTTELFFGKTKAVAVYNTALTDAELIALTTL